MCLCIFVCVCVCMCTCVWMWYYKVGTNRAKVKCYDHEENLLFFKGKIHWVSI